MKNDRLLKYNPQPSDIGSRLDKFLGTLEAIGSRSRAAQLVNDKRVVVNGRVEKVSYQIRKDDVISVTLPELSLETDLAPLALNLDIVHEDDDIIVVNKPAGLVVHPAAGHSGDTLVNALLHHTKNLSMGFGENRPGIVHRLDRDTSGLIVIAKNDLAHRALAKQFKNKTVHRIYWALVYGVPKTSKGRIESLLARHRSDRKRFASSKNEGRMAITNYEVIQPSASHQTSLLRLKLETGRTHQIRVHLSEMGHPILADKVYGSDSRLKGLKSVELRKTISGMTRFALHAAELGFRHPITEKELRFKVKWPDDLLTLVQVTGLEYEL